LLQSTYANYEIVILDRDSDDPKLKQYYEILRKNPRIRIVEGEKCDNVATLNNRAAEHATGEYLLLLSNRIEIITPGWIEEMLMYAQRDDVAAVGSLLYFPDNTVRHAGIVLGLGDNNVAGHLFYRTPRNSVGYMGRLGYAQNLSAVTAACMMVKASSYREVGGMDESFVTAYADVDLCMRLRQSGQLIVWTPHAEAYYYENKAHASDFNVKRRMLQDKEASRFRERWERELNAGDPYFNPNFLLNNSEFRPR
jgi:GT2 family glycosyltransferase